MGAYRKPVLICQPPDSGFKCRIFLKHNVCSAVRARRMVVVMVEVVTQLYFILPASMYFVGDGQHFKQLDRAVNTGTVYVWAVRCQLSHGDSAMLRERGKYRLTCHGQTISLFFEGGSQGNDFGVHVANYNNIATVLQLSIMSASLVIT